MKQRPNRAVIRCTSCCSVEAVVALPWTGRAQILLVALLPVLVCFVTYMLARPLVGDWPSILGGLLLQALSSAAGIYLLARSANPHGPR